MSKMWFLKKMIFVFWNLIYEIWILKSDFWNLDFWNLISLPKAMSISRSEILRKQEHKVSYICSLPSPLQKRSKDFKELQDWIGAKTQVAIFVGDLLRFPPGLLVILARASCSGLRSSYFSFWAWSPGGSLRLSKFMCDTKPKEVLCWNQCNPLILGSPLQWRWQWASIGHFVFLFSTSFNSFNGTFSGTLQQKYEL